MPFSAKGIFTGIHVSNNQAIANKLVEHLFAMKFLDSASYRLSSAQKQFLNEVIHEHLTEEEAAALYKSFMDRLQTKSNPESAKNEFKTQLSVDLYANSLQEFKEFLNGKQSEFSYAGFEAADDPQTDLLEMVNHISNIENKMNAPEAMSDIDVLMEVQQLVDNLSPLVDQHKLSTFSTLQRKIYDDVAKKLHDIKQKLNLESERPPAPFLDFITLKLNQERHSGNKLVLSANPGTVAVARPLVRGREIYPAMGQAVRNAKQEILLMGYKLDKNCDGEKDLMDALNHLNNQAKDAKQSIRVRILINRRAGVAGRYKPNIDSSFRIGQLFPNLDFQYAEHTHTGFGSFHSKMLIVDGTLAFMPTCDLSKVDNYQAGNPNWVDIASVFCGSSLVDHLRNDFVHAWNSKASSPLNEKKSSIPALPRVSDQAPEKADDSLETNAVFISKKAHGYLTHSHLSPYAIASIEAFKQAKSTICLMTPNLNEDNIIKALADANHRGVTIKIVMGRNKGDKAEGWMGGTNQEGIQRLFNEVKKRGGNHLNIQVHWATDDNGRMMTTDSHVNTLHARMICADNVVIVGSSVCDNQSIYHSREADVIMESPDVAEMYRNTIFYPIFNRGISFRDDPRNSIQSDPQGESLRQQKKDAGLSPDYVTLNDLAVKIISEFSSDADIGDKKSLRGKALRRLISMANVASEPSSSQIAQKIYQSLHSELTNFRRHEHLNVVCKEFLQIPVNRDTERGKAIYYLQRNAKMFTDQVNSKNTPLEYKRAGHTLAERVDIYMTLDSLVCKVQSIKEKYELERKQPAFKLPEVIQRLEKKCDEVYKLIQKGDSPEKLYDDMIKELKSLHKDANSKSTLLFEKSLLSTLINDVLREFRYENEMPSAAPARSPRSAG